MANNDEIKFIIGCDDVTAKGILSSIANLDKLKSAADKAFGDMQKRMSAMSFSPLNRAIVDVGANLASSTARGAIAAAAEFGKMKNHAENFLNDINRKLSVFDLTPIARQLASLGLKFAVPAAAATGTAAAFYGLAQTTANAGDELNKLSQKTGMGVGELYSLKKMAAFANTDIAALSLGLKSFAEKLEEARKKQGEARSAFDLIGVDYTKPMSQAFQEFARQMDAMGAGEARLNTATQLLGRNGMELIPLLGDIASKGIEVSNVFDDKTAKAASEFNDNITRLKQNALEFTYTLGNKLIPVLNGMFDAFNKTPADKIVEDLQGADSAINDLGHEIAAIRNNWDYTNALDTTALTDKLLRLVDSSQHPIRELTRDINNLQNTINAVGVENAGYLNKQLEAKQQALAMLYKEAGKGFADQAASAETAMPWESRFNSAAFESLVDETLKGVDEKIKNTNDSISQSVAQFYGDMRTKNDDWVTYHLNKIEEEKSAMLNLWRDNQQAFTKAGITQNSIEQWAHDNSMARISEYTEALKRNERDEIEIANARRAAYSDMYSALKYDAQNYYDYQKELLEKQREENIRVTGDMELAWQAYYARLRELDEERMLRTGTFADGITVFYQRMERDGFTWAKASNQLMHDFTSGAQSGITGLLKGIETDTANIGKHLKNFIKDFAGMFLDAVNKMIAQWLIMKAITGIAGAFAAGSGGSAGSFPQAGTSGYVGGGWATSIHTGGYVADAGKIKSYHTGGLNSDEIYAKLQTDEYVQSRKGVKAAGIPAMHALNRGDLPAAISLLSDRTGMHEREIVSDSFSAPQTARSLVDAAITPAMQTVYTQPPVSGSNPGASTTNQTYQTDNHYTQLSITAVDSRSFERMLYENKGALFDLIAKGVNQNTSFAREVRGKR